MKNKQNKFSEKDTVIKNMVYVILADGFEEIEAMTPVDVLRRAGADVKTLGITGKKVIGAHGITVECDLCESDDSFDITKAEMLVFPGGMPGASNIDSFEKTDGYIKTVLENCGYIGAICAAPMILGRRGYLKGKHAVCFPGFEKYLTGAEISDLDVVRDGNIVTSRCMGTSLPFAIELVSCLYGSVKAESVKAAVMGLS